MTGWVPSSSAKYAVAIYNFAASGPFELQLSVGDAVQILEESTGWYRGFITRSRKDKGIFPKGYVHIKEAAVQCNGDVDDNVESYRPRSASCSYRERSDSRSYRETVRRDFLDTGWAMDKNDPKNKSWEMGLDGFRETVTPKETPVVHELTTVCREWGVLWKSLYVDREMELFDHIHKMSQELIDCQRKILSGTLPVDELKELKQIITTRIDLGNRKLGLDLVIRDEEGGTLDPIEQSTVHLYRMHEIAQTRIGQQEKSLNSFTGTTHRFKKASAIYSYNLFVTVKNVVCRIGEDADVLMSLYDANESQFISENYVVKWSKTGTPMDLDLLYNLKTLFTDLGAKDLQREKVFLVCQIIRIGRMELKEGVSEKEMKKFTTGLKRPFGVAALEITDFLSGKIDTDEDKQLFLPFQQCSTDESLEALIKRFVVAKEINHKGQGIWAALKLVAGEVKQIRKEYPHLVDQKTAIARKMGFPEVIMPGDVRNDVYVTLIQGEFDRGSRPKPKNVEVGISVCNEDCNVLKDVIYTAAGESASSSYQSVVYYQVKTPRFNETVKVAIPIEQFTNANTHLRFSFKHRSATDAKDKQEKVFAIAYLRLMTDIGTTITNGTHELLVYKVDKSHDHIKAYLGLPATRLDTEHRRGSSDNRRLSTSSHGSGSHLSVHQVKGLTLSSKESLTISTVVCSTKLTQNVDLLGLLKWKSDRSNIKSSLASLMKVDGEEVVKFLQDTLDALFGIMTESPHSDEYDEPVFNALIFIIGLIADRKYQQFRPVLDTYIREHYSVTFADLAAEREKFLNKMPVVVTSKLMRVLKNYLDNAGEKGTQELLLKSLKALEYIFRFVIRSRELFIGLYGDTKGRVQFESSIRDVFLSLKWLMTYTQTDMLSCQGAAMKYIPSVITDTMTQFNPVELSQLLKEFLQALPAERLVKQKLDCIKDLVHSDIYKKRECRAVLTPMITMQIKQLMDKREEMKTCAEVLTELLNMLHQKGMGSTHADISEVMHTLLRTVIQSVVYMYVDDDTVLIGRYVSCMVSILRQMTEYHYSEYINAFSTRVDLVDFLMEIFLVFRDLISKAVYPSDWMTMIMQQNSVILFAMKQFAKVLNRSFVRIEEFEFQLWNNFFHLAVAFVTQDALQLENFSVGKRAKILEQYGDMRREVGFEIIRTMWNYLGKNKIKFIPEMVGPFIEVTLIPETELRKATIPIFFDMMQCEFQIKGNFNKFEHEIISQLDALVEGGRGDDGYRELFKQIMGDFCQQHQFLCGDGLHFVNLVSKLLVRLLDYRAIINEESKENRMSCTVNLLNFYKDIDRQDMYVRYLYKLCDLHLQCDNYTEAAFALQLHADRLKWSNNPLIQINDRYPEARSERDLKIMLFSDVMKYFDKGKLWEKAIALCKELGNQYEKETFDYIELSKLLQTQSHYFDQIMQIPRPAPEYFKVYYIGRAFPSFLRNKMFIYRGKDYERLADFVARLQQQFPNAQLMNKTTQPDKSVLESEGQILQIVPVQPMREDRRDFRGKMISEQILSYYSVNEVQKFTYSRPFHKGKKDKENEFKTMWIERTYFSTAYKLPGILRWFEVTSYSQEEFSPIRNAIETMEDVNRKLRTMILRYQEDPTLPINPLSLQLNGVIDSAVMGGPAMYEKAFCVDDYASDNPEDAIHIQRLKELFAEQIPLVEIGLAIHDSKISEGLRPFQQKMEDMFVKRKEIVEIKYGKKLLEDLAIRPNDRLIQSFAKRLSRPSTVTGRPLSTMSSSSGSSGTESRSSMISNPDSTVTTSSKSSDKHKGKDLAKTKDTASPAKVPIAKRNSKEITTEDLEDGGTPKETPKPIILDEKLSSARPLRKNMKKANHSPLPRPMKAVNPTKTASGDVPPLLPPKQAYSDYSNLPSMNNAPKKPPKTIQVLPNKEKAPPLPAKSGPDSSSNSPSVMRRKGSNASSIASNASSEDHLA